MRVMHPGIVRCLGMFCVRIKTSIDNLYCSLIYFVFKPIMLNFAMQYYRFYKRNYHD
jgi:hypothetical protein